MLNVVDEIKDTFWWFMCTIGSHDWVIAYSARGRTTYKCCRFNCDARKYLIESE